MRGSRFQRMASLLAVLAALSAGPAADAKSRTVGFSRAVFRMEQGVAWGHVSGGTNCDVDLERLQWGREGSEIHTQRLGVTFNQVMGEIVGGRQDENLFEEAAAATDLQIAAAISDMRANLCEQGSLSGYSGSLSMTVQWQVYDPGSRQVVGKFETHAAGQTAQTTADGLDALFLAAFRQNARDLMSDSGFQRLLKAPATSEPVARGGFNTAHINFTPAVGGSLHALPQTVQSVVMVLTSGAYGSGFLISPEGYILTNAHVVGSSRTVRIRWADGTEGPGQVLRTDRQRDIALVKVDAPSGKPLALHAALPGQGEAVFAIGAPLDPGLQGTLTRGIVSANRVIDGQPFIQSDVAVTHGNSGGPLLNERGEVIGVTVSGFVDNGGPLGLNMFIPIADALRALSLEPIATKSTLQPSTLARPRPVRRDHSDSR
jgi:serine protease Do